MFRFSLLVLALALLFGGCLPVQAQSSLALVSTDPIIPCSDHGTWRSMYNEPGALIYHDGLYHLFITSGSSWPSPSGIGYASSEDGIHWDILEDPILTKQDMDYAPISIGASSVYVEEDGTWVMYFYNLHSSSWPNNKSNIGRATAPAPTGPWTPDPAPVLLPGEKGSWDQDSVLYPSVIPTDDGYVMFYTGQTEKGNVQQVGMATSEDGITWIKNPDPVFTLKTNEHPTALMTSVIPTSDGYAMIFKDSRSSFSFAVSQDGLTWERLNGGKPLLAARDVPGLNNMGIIEFIATDDGYYFVFEGEGPSTTQVYAATGTVE